MTFLKRLAVASAMVFALASCGGGDSGGSSSGQTAVTVVPALGAFSAGATVEIYNATTGVLIGNPTTTGSDGTATIDLGAFTDPFVIKVYGAATGVTYYDENNQTTAPLLANDVLLAMVPASAAVSTSARIGVTPLTHMAAAFAGLSANNLQVIPTAGTVASTMLNAYARVRYAMGLGLQSDNAAKRYLNPLLAPAPLSASTIATGVDLSRAGGYYGLFLAELAKNGALSTSQFSPMGFANRLAAEAETMRAPTGDGRTAYDDTARDDFQASEASTVLNQTTVSVAATNGSGAPTSTFANRCIAIPTASRLAINGALTNANGAFKLQPTDGELSQLAAELNSEITTQLSGAPVNMTGTRLTGGGC